MAEDTKAKCLNCGKPLMGFYRDVCVEQNCVLYHIKQLDEHDRMAANDFRKQKAVEAAVSAVHRIILDRSNGSVEETEYLTAQVGERILKSALASIYFRLQDKETRERHEERVKPNV